MTAENKIMRNEEMAWVQDIDTETLLKLPLKSVTTFKYNNAVTFLSKARLAQHIKRRNQRKDRGVIKVSQNSKELTITISVYPVGIYPDYPGKPRVTIQSLPGMD